MIDPGPQPPAPPRPSWWSTLGWAAYLACSWTWCIGMFLPVLLVRDYGIWGFVVFAVPNVVGAAAMGWVLRRPGAAADILSRHRAACVWFSAVTIAFQIFFDMQMPGELSTSWLVNARGGHVVIAAFVVLALWRSLGAASALLVWAASLVLLCMAWTQAPSTALPRPVSSMGAIWLAPVCTFGFALCPYLDLTFLRARHQCVGPRGTTAFAVGFGVLFLTMILGTLAYSTGMLTGCSPEGDINFVDLVALHVMLQLGFTIVVHGRELQRPGVTARTSLVVIGALLSGVVAGAVSIVLRDHAGLTGWEIIYRCFMSFYGLLFPAYVWLCMIPTPDGHSGLAGPQGKRKLTVLAIACALAAPCYWMGFIERIEWWLAPGLGIVLFARLLVRPSSQRTASLS